jgi:subtilisin-like proprotein convertase family protein
MRSTLCPDPRILSNGECNCFTLQQGGQPPPRRCNLTSLCDPDSVPDDSGCGCRRFDSPRICAGNILSATKPVINFHSNVSALAGRPVLSVDTTMPIVTRSVSTNMLTNGNQLGFDVFNPNDGGAMTATADVRCTNLQAGVSNYLVDRLTLPDIGSGKVANVTANFSTADLDRCFGTSRTGSSNFEIKFSPSRSVARISYVANRTFASILDPIFPEQPCTFPTVGPTPRPTWNLSTGEVLRRDLPIVYPTMLESGLIAAPATVVDPVVFTRDYGTSPLALLDRSNTPTTSQLAVSHVGPIQGLTLQLRLRGNTRASRYGVTLVAPNGTAVYSTSSIAGDGENFDAGLVATLAAAVEGQGNWTLQVRDFGGTNGGAKSGDLYAWSLNFNPAETWEDDATESTTYPSGWSCNGRDGFEDIPGEFYGDGGCDCGCGALDIDCASNSVSACEYVFCRSGQNVNPNNNALCQ